MAVVVIAWNSGDALADAVASAWRQNPQEVVVVDNHSTDHSIAGLRHRFRGVHVISLAQNVGFAAACNVGIAWTRAPYLFFLNDDAVLAPGHLQILLQALGPDLRAASAQGKLTYQDGGVRRIDSAGLRLDRYALRPTDRGQGERDDGQYDTPARIFGPTGAAALYRRTALDAAGEGGFDSRLFAYYEDVDLAWRLGNLGWHHLYEPRALATPARRGPRNKPRAIMERAFVNRYTVWVKNERPVRALWYAPCALMWEAARLARLLRRDPTTTWRIVRQAPRAILRGVSARRTPPSSKAR